MIKTLLCASITALALFSTHAQAEIIYLNDNRSTFHSLIADTGSVPVSPYADFDNTTWGWEAGTYQNSTLGSSSMSGTGNTYAGWDALDHYGAWTSSVFDVSFAVDQQSQLSLSGYLDTGWNDSYLFVELYENEQLLYTLDSWALINFGATSFSYDGILASGSTYQLILSSTSYMSDYYYEEWGFNLQTSAVPIPAAVWLFGSGLVALGFAGRRRVVKL